MKSLSVFITNVAFIVLTRSSSSSALITWSILPSPSVDALSIASASTSMYHTFVAQQMRAAKHRERTSLNLADNGNAADISIDDSSSRTSTRKEAHANSKSAIYTTAVLTLAYDGTHFRGFTASNSGESNENRKSKKDKDDQNKQQQQQQQRPDRRQSRRSRTLQRKGGSYGHGNNAKLRTVEDVLRKTLAKVYGDVDPKRITIECCSRTDKGVHATSMVAQFYCSTKPKPSSADADADADTDDDVKGNPTQSQSAIPIRPNSHDDVSNFQPLPFNSDLSKLMFVLNRMLPPDARVVRVSPLPYVPPSTPSRGALPTSITTTNGAETVAFHPTLHTMSKTYTYKFAIGPVHDPLQNRYVWHLDGSSSRAVGMNGKRFCLERALQAAQLFVDSNDESCMNMDTAKSRDYGAFRSAFRGTDRGRVQSTICKLWRCEILGERKELLPSWETDAPAREGNDAANNMERLWRHGSRLRKSRSESPGSTQTSTATAAAAESSTPQTFTVVITGDRFLYKMIRNIVGTIVAVGCGHLELDDVRIALDTGKWGGSVDEDTEEDVGEATSEEVAVSSSSSAEPNVKTRTIRRICAPARGLTLTEVHYPEDIDFNWQSG